MSIPPRRPSAIDALNRAILDARARRSTPPPAPAASSSSPGSVPARERRSSVPPRPAILVVSDATDALVASSTLSDLGQVTVAHDAAIAAEACADQVPSLVVIDGALPDWGGVNLTRRLRGTAASSRVPIMVLGTGDATLVVEAINAGARYVLRRPLEVTELRARARMALR